MAATELQFRKITFTSCCNENDILEFKYNGTNYPTLVYPNPSLPLPSGFTNSCYQVTISFVPFDEWSPLPDVSSTPPSFFNKFENKEAECAEYVFPNGCPECNPQCYTLYNCDGGQFNTTNDLSAFVYSLYGQPIQIYDIDTGDIISGSWYVYINEGPCTDINNNFGVNDVGVPECLCRCFEIVLLSSKGSVVGVQYIDCDGNLITNSTATKFCSKVYPLVKGNGYEIIEGEECVDGLCPQQCFKLTSCDDENNIFYSNSDSLSAYVNDTNNVVQILNKPGCWEVTLSKGNCNCINITFTGPFGTDTYTANSIGTYNGANVYQFTANNGDVLFIWFIPEKGWFITANSYGDVPSLEIASSSFLGDCPDSVNENFTWLPSEFIGDTIETEVCPSECDCPIEVTVIRNFVKCEDCKPIIAYKLIACEDGNVIYTYSDLQDYIGQVIKFDCGCYEVEQINFAPPNPQEIILEAIYPGCLECSRQHWVLEDCTGESNAILTYTDLSLYEGKVVKIENCPGCWTVTASKAYENATTVVVTDVYNDCPECGIPTICECTRVTNLNDSPKVYGYYDCDNVYNEITLEPGQTSDKICAIRWIPQQLFCECIKFELIDAAFYAFIIPEKLYNGYPIYVLCDRSTERCGSVYYENGAWVIEIDGFITWKLTDQTSTTCPYGTWEPVSQEETPRPKAAAIEEGLVSSECDIEGFCNCFTMTQSGPGGTTISTFYVTFYDPRSNYPTYTNDLEFINYDPDTGCWYFPQFATLQSTLCNDGECPIGQWESALEGVTIITEACEPTPSSEFTYLDHFETFGECKFGNCPQPVFKNNRTVKPGYNTPICSPEKYDKITCKFADIMYKLALEKRYGITNCCPEEDDRWLIQKELIDLQALKDPNYKCQECGCACNNNSCQTCNCKN